MALLIDAERRSNADALEPGAVLLIPRDSFMRTLRNHPASAIRLRDFCARRLAAFTSSLGAAADAVVDEAND
jgi:CRP-like cAMP-binding protein